MAIGTRLTYYPTLAVCVALLVAISKTVSAAEMPSRPILRIETGTHVGKITSMAVSTINNKGGHYIVTGSIDKTVRVWWIDKNANKLRLVDTIYPPMGNGGVGHIYAVAISPNGKLIACGGWTVEDEKFSIYIYRKQREKDKFDFLKKIPDTANPEVKQILKNPITHMALTDKYLIAGFSIETELRVYSLSGFNLVATDNSYKKDERIEEINYTESSVLTLSSNGTLRLYDLDRMESGKWRLLSGRDKPIAPVVTKNFLNILPTSLGYYLNKGTTSGRIAIAWLGQPKQQEKSSSIEYHLNVFDKDSLKSMEEKDFTELKQTYRQSIPSKALKVAWSANRKSLYVLCDDGKIYMYAVSSGDNVITVTKNDEIEGAQNINNFVLSEDKGRDNIIFVSDNIDLGCWNAERKCSPEKSVAINFERLAEEIKRVPPINSKVRKVLYVSDDGVDIWYAVQRDNKYYHATVSEAVIEGKVITVEQIPEQFVLNENLAVSGKCGEVVSGNTNTVKLEPAVNEREVQRTLNCLPVMVNDDFYLIGTRWNIRVYDRGGKEMKGNSLSLPAPVVSLNLVQNDKVAVAALGDGTIRWYRITDEKKLEEILSFFPAKGKTAGIFWTPSGYFGTTTKEFGDFGFDTNSVGEGPSGFQPCTPAEMKSETGECVDQFESKYGSYRREDIFKWILEEETLGESKALEKVRSENRADCGKGMSHRISPWFPEIKNRLADYALMSMNTKNYLNDRQADIKSFHELLNNPKQNTKPDTNKKDDSETKCKKSPIVTVLRNEDISIEDIKRGNKFKIKRAKAVIDDLETQVNDLIADLTLYSSSVTTPQSARRILSSPVNENRKTHTDGKTKDTAPNITVATKGSWDTELLAGLTDFIFDRAEQELIRWYVDQWVKKFCTQGVSNSNSWELCKLTSDSNESEVISRSALFQAIRNDLENMPAEILYNLNMNGDQQFFSYVMIDMLKKVSRGAAPANIIAGLGDSEDVRKACLSEEKKRPLSCSLYMSGVIMQAYLGAIEAREYKEIVWNDVFLQAIDKLDHDLNNNTKYSEAFNDLKLRLVQKHVEIKRALTRYADLLQNEEIMARDLEGFGSETDKSAYADRLLLAVRMSRSVAAIVSSMYPVLDVKQETLEYADLVVNSTAALVSGQYADAAKNIREIIHYNSVNLCHEMSIPGMDCSFKTQWILDQFKKQKDRYKEELRKCNKYNRCSESSENRQYSDNSCLKCQQKADIVSLIEKYDPESNGTMKQLETLAPVYKYLPVMAELANVRTKDDVKTVLNNVSSPVGAWSMKEKKDVHSIGALVGGQISYEHSDGVPNGKSMGLFAPVGLDLTFPTDSSSRYIGSYGAFFSIIDLGNYATTRYTNNDQVESKSDIGWPQVISLGANFHWNIKKSPIVFGIGYSYAPQLRTIKTDTGETVNRGCKRIKAFIAVDVTLWPF